MKRCGRRYGRGLVCKRLTAHIGNHAIRLTIGELRRTLLTKRQEAKSGSRTDVEGGP